MAKKKSEKAKKNDKRREVSFGQDPLCGMFDDGDELKCSGSCPEKLYDDKDNQLDRRCTLVEIQVAEKKKRGYGPYEWKKICICLTYAKDARTPMGCRKKKKKKECTKKRCDGELYSQPKGHRQRKPVRGRCFLVRRFRNNRMTYRCVCVYGRLPQESGRRKYKQ